MNLLHAIDVHQNKPKLSLSWNASGKEKSNRTHTNLGLNLWGGMKNRSNDMLNCKDGTGTHDWQSQNDDCNHQLCAAEYHQEESQFPKADMKGNQEILVSEDLQTKNCNRLTIKWSKATSEEENPQTTPKTSSNLKALTCDADVTPQLTPKRTY